MKKHISTILLLLAIVCIFVSSAETKRTRTALPAAAKEKKPRELGKVLFVAPAPPTVSKTFGVASIALNGSTSLSFTVTNPNTDTALSGVAFTDTLPGGLQLTSTTVTGACGSGTITATVNTPPGTPSTVTLSGGTLAQSPDAGFQCTFSVDVTGITAGAQSNTTDAVTSTEGGTGTTSNTAVLNVDAPPTISKLFNPSTIALNATTSLDFTITNPAANAEALTGVAFSDTLPAGLTIADSSAGQCGGTLTTTAATRVISLSGGTINTNSNCQFSVTVTGAAAGSYNNTVNGAGKITSTNGGTGVDSNTATLNVEAPPTISKLFNPSTIALNATTSLDFTITNPAANPEALIGVAFTDTLPTGLTGTNGTSSVCGGVNNLNISGTNIIILLGTTIATNSQCQFSVTVTGAAAGNYDNTVNGAGKITSNNGGTGVDSNTANLIVVAPPTIQKLFGVAIIPVNGTASLTFNIQNPNTSVTLNGIAYTDTLPPGLVVANPPNLTGNCGGTVTNGSDGALTANDTSIKLASGTLAGSASCTVSVNVQGTSTGVKNNSVQVTSTEGGTGNTSNASITVVPCPTSFTVDNNGDAHDAIPGDATCATAGAVCTLRAAIEEANALTPCGGTIDINFNIGSSTITLANGQLTIDHNVNLNGPSANAVVISGNNLARVLTVNSGKTVAISNLTIDSGRAAFGGGIYNQGALILTSSTISNNQTINGVDATGAANGGNSGDGGGIYSTGALTLINSTISGNKTGRGGDASGTGNGGNSGNGGAIYHTGTLTLTNTTVTNNQTGRVGAPTGSNITGIPGLIVGVGGGIFKSGGTLILNNTIVAGNRDGFSNPDDINGTVDSSSSFNLIGTDAGLSGISNGSNGNQIGSDPPLSANLGPLAANGGPTKTHLLQQFSPAINAGSNALAKDQSNIDLAFDQRGTGFPRIVNGTVDIGAVELNAPPLPPGTDLAVSKSANVDQVVPNRDITYTITLNNQGGDAASSVTLSDILPQVTTSSSPVPTFTSMTFVSLSSPAGWSCSTPSVGAGGTITCTRATLAGGSSQVFTLIGHVPSGAVPNSDFQFISNQATATTTSSDSNSENDTGTASTLLVACISNPVVTTSADSGVGSLRQAIIDACDGATITFDMSQVVSPITLTSGELVINKSLTIQGPGASLLTISGNNTFRVFNVSVANPGVVTFSGLTISNGKNGAGGGGILNNNTGTINLIGSALSGNAAPSGAGIYNNNGAINIIDSTLNNNSATSGGGGIFNALSGAINITNSTFSFNSTAGSSNGGGINNFNNGPVTITNSTFSNNSADGGGGIFNGGGTPVQLRNTILALNTATVAGPDVSGAFTSNGHNLIGNNSAGTITPAPGATGDLIGTNASPINPLLGALQNNGGPTQTRALLLGSPALDAGDNCVADIAHCGDPNIPQLTTDQRGAGFSRIVDGPDADTTDTVDIGAFEAQVSVEDITDKATNEDTQLQFTFNVGGAASITSVTATSGNTALVPNNPANIAVSGSGSTRTLTINPLADQFGGTSIITVTVNGANSQSMTDTFVLTVNAVADTPSVTNATTNEDTQTASGLVINRNAADGAEVTHFKINGIANGTLFQNNGTTVINNNDFITVAQGNAGLKFTPAANLFSPTSNFSFQAQASLNNSNAGLGGGLATATITVNPVADTPSVTNATTSEDTQTSSGLVISRNPADSTEVTHFKITGITNGTLFQNNGTTQINNGDFITVAQGNAGLKFTPAANLFSPATTFSFQVQASLNNTNAGLGGGLATATITVNLVSDTPSVTNATTNEDTQTTTGLVISRNPADGAEVTHFKVTSITGGTLFQNNGTTQINNGDFITVAQGAAGLKFTPAANLFSPATTFSFQAQASLNNTNAGLGGGLATATITVNAVNDAPVNHVPGAQTIPLNALFVFSTATGNSIFISDVDAGSDPVQVTLKATDGTLTLNGTAGLTFSAGDGTDDQTMTFTGSIANINAALEGMKNLAFGSGVIEITTNDLGRNGAGGALSDTDTITVTVIDNLAPVLLTIPGSDRAIAFDSVTFVVDPFSLVGSNNFTADHRTHITLFALHAQLRPGETLSAITAEADVSGTVVPLIVESVNTVPNFDWLTQLVVKFPDHFSTGGGGPHDAKIRIRLRGANSNQVVITIVPAPTGF